MKKSIIEMIREFIRQIRINRRWRNTVTCMAALIVFVTTYVLILPAITMGSSHPRLSADAVTAWAGDPMSVTVSAESPAGSGEKVVVLTAEAVEAGLSEEYEFDSDGVTVIADSMGQEIRLHRTVREGNEDQVDYWFILAAGQKTEFTLDLQDEIDVKKVMASAGIVKNVRTEKDAEKASASDAEKAEAVATASDAVEVVPAASASDAVKETVVETATASAASKATPANAEDGDEDEDGHLLDGAVLNDLDISDLNEETEVTASLKFLAGMGDDLEEAIRDAERSAEKRGDAIVEFRWRMVVTNTAEELTWEENGVSVRMFYSSAAGLPDDARLFVAEIPRDSAEYQAYLESAKGAVGVDAAIAGSADPGTDDGQKRSVNYARFFDIRILDADGNEVEPEAQVVVKIDYDEAENISEDTGVQMVHFPKEGGTELVEAVVDGEGEELNGIAFKANGFSVYGIVGTGSWVSTFLSADGNTYEVTVTSDVDASIPADAQLIVSEVEEGSEKYNEYIAGAVQTLGVSEDIIAYRKLLDISIMKDGVDVTPKLPVSVQIRLLDKKDSPEKVSLNVIHYEGGSETPTVVEGSEKEDGTVQFETEGFSVYGVFYTVDFHYEVNGKTFEYSIPGGGYIRFSDIAEVLGLAKQNAPAEDKTAEEENAPAEDKTAEEENAPAEENTAEAEKAEEDGSAETADKVEISEETKKFVENIESIEFSSPELVWVGKTVSETTVGALKEENKLETQYSGNLSEVEIAKINAETLQAGEWVLVSRRPFTSEEVLTIVMKNGEKFSIRVTDAVYAATKVTDLDGKTVALLNLTNKNALQSTAHSAAGRLQSEGITFNTPYTTDGDLISPVDHIVGPVETSTPDATLTEWEFQKAPGTDGFYYIKASNGYLHIDVTEDGNLLRVVEEDPQPLELQKDANGRIRILTRNAGRQLAVNNNANETANGYGIYGGSSWNRQGDWQNPGEWFVPYEIRGMYVNLHFVDEDGHPLADPVTITHDKEGDYGIDLEELYGSIDKDGKSYTLSSTRKDSYTDLFENPNHKWEQKWEQPHRIIGNDLRWHDGRLQYRFFYTNGGNDFGWYDVGTRPHIAEYDSSKTRLIVPDGDDKDQPRDDTYVYPTGGIYDYYLVYSERPEDPEEPGPEPEDPTLDDIDVIKDLTNNYDGTYNLELGASIPAETKALKNAINVVVVFDTSSSMLRSTLNNKYPPAYEAAREDDTDVDPNPFIAPREAANPDYANSRFSHAVNSISEFVRSLKNNLPDENAVMLALISFNKEGIPISFSEEEGGTTSDWTTNADLFIQELTNLQLFPGTNWGDGLSLADQLSDPDVLVDGQPREADTYVLFVTDGGPSQYWHNTTIPGNTYFAGGECSFYGSRDDGRAVIRNGKTMYGVFAFGSQEDRELNYIGRLMNYAYDDPSAESLYAFYAEDSDELARRLKSILKVLSKDFTYADVTINDGITDLTEVTFEAPEADNREEFSYEISYKDYVPKEGGGYDINTITLDLTDRVSGSGNNQIIDIPSVTYHYLINDSIVEKTTEPTQLAGAVFTEKSGSSHKKVVWDIKPAGAAPGSHYDPNPGWTYKVKFKIWPNQDTYDIIAALNNGLLIWGRPYKGSTAYMDQIYKDSNDRYVERTNVQEEAYVEYSQHTTIEKPDERPENLYTPPYPVSLPEVGGMPLDNTWIRLKKIWNTDLHEEDYEKIRTVDLYILQDNVSASGFNKKDPDTYYMKVTLTKSNGWEENVSISPGICDYVIDHEDPDDDGHYRNKTTGHAYSVLEPDIDSHYELEATPVKPMLDGKTATPEAQRDMIDIYGQEAAPLPWDDDYEVSVYSVENTLKGGINIYKEIEGMSATDSDADPDPEALFTFKVTLRNENGGIKSRAEGGDVVEGDVGYRIFLPKDKPIPAGATDITETQYTFNGNTFKKQKDGSYIARGTLDNVSADGKDGDVTLEMRSCEFIRIANVPMGTTYTVEEQRIEDVGFEFVKARVEVVTGKDPDPILIEEVDAPAAPKTGADPDNPIEIEPNAENNVTFTNKFKPVDLRIFKIEKDNTKKPLAGAQFTIRKIKDTLAGSSIAYDGDESDPVVTDENGEARFSRILQGYYEIRERKTPDGYVITGDDCFYIKVDKSVIYLLEKDMKKDPKDWNSTKTKVGNVTFTAATDDQAAAAQIENTPGAALPNSGGPGTLLYTLGGLAVICASALMYGFRMRLRRKEVNY